ASANKISGRRKIKVAEVFWVTMEIRLPQPISRIVFRCSGHTKGELLARMPIREGAMLSDELLQRARETATACNERLRIQVRHSLRQEEFLKAAPEIRKTFI